MEWLHGLLFEHSPLQAVVILSILIATGLGLGKIRIFGISLGVTFVFFTGILVSIDARMLDCVETFGLVLFVYELGMQVGPGFFSSFRKGGVQQNMLALTYADDTLPGGNPPVSYATVYPLPMFSRVIIAQLMLLFFI